MVKRRKTPEELLADLRQQNMADAVRRAEETARFNQAHDRVVAQEMQSMFEDFFDDIQKEINAAWAGGLDPTSKVNQREYQKLIRKIDNMLMNGESLSNISDEQLRKYRAIAQLNKLRMLEAQLGQVVNENYRKIEGFFGNELNEEALRGLQQGAGIFDGFVTNHAALNLEQVVNADFYGAEWFDRLYAHSEELVNELNKILSRALVRGENPTQYASGFAKAFDISSKAARDLLITEASRVNAAAQKAQFAYMAFEEYEFVATEDEKTCPVCGALHGKRFKVKDMEPGQNCHPMHTKCRCTATGAFDSPEEVMARLERAGKI